MKFNHSTRAQLATRLRAKYATATGLQAVTLGAWMVANLSDAELQAAFGLPSQGAVNSLKGRLNAQAAKLNGLKTAVGE